MTGIKHIEIWVSDMKRSLDFYDEFFGLIGWERIHEREFRAGGNKIYFIERKDQFSRATLGPRHICFHAESREIVNRVFEMLQRQEMPVIRGPVEMPYSTGYYTVDFKDPDGYILEVAHSL